MRLALFTDSFDQINGVSNTLKRVVRYAREHEHNLDVYTYDLHREWCETTGSVRVFRFKPVYPIHYYSDMYWDAVTLRRAILRRCEAEKYDLLHVASPASMGLNALLLAHRLKLPLVGTYHTALPEYTNPRVANFCRRVGLDSLRLGDRAERAMWLYMSWFYGRCKLVLAPSQAVKSQLEQHMKSQVEVFSRGIDTERFHPRHGYEPPRLTVLYVGRISIEKNLEVVARMAKKRTSIRFVFVGDGPYKKALQEQLPNAEFPGFLTGEALSRAYASADIFVFPSVTDTFGNVVLEAMSSGLPVIVSNQMGPAELVQDRKTGFIACNEVQFLERLDWLAEKPAVRKAMGEQARAFALTRNWDAVLRSLFLHYESVLSGGIGLTAASETNFMPAQNSNQGELPNVSSAATSSAQLLSSGTSGELTGERVAQG